MNDGFFIDKEGLSRLPLLDRAELKGGLRHDEYLSIKQITELLCPVYPHQKERETFNEWTVNRRRMIASRDSYKREIIKACENGLITFEGNIKGWNYSDKNPYPLASSGVYRPYRESGEDWITGEPILRQTSCFQCYSFHCTIHRDNFKRYLQSQKQWPVTGLLVNWWANNQPKAETLGDGEEVKVRGKRDRQVDIICKIAIELGYVDLLNIPEGGRAAIKAKCQKNNLDLFSDDAFKRAWTEANKRGLIRVKNKEKYLSNQ